MSHKTPSGRLRESGVREIRERRAKGEKLQSIATAMGVSLGTVWNVVNGKTWAWLK